MSPLTINPSTRCKLLVSFTPWPLHPQENKSRIIEYEAGWTPEPVWKLGRKTGLPPVPGVETGFPGCATCTSVTGSLGVQSLLMKYVVTFIFSNFWLLQQNVAFQYCRKQFLFAKLSFGLDVANKQQDHPYFLKRNRNKQKWSWNTKLSLHT
jgi:hypothetical protein